MLLWERDQPFAVCVEEVFHANVVPYIQLLLNIHSLRFSLRVPPHLHMGAALVVLCGTCTLQAKEVIMTCIWLVGGVSLYCTLCSTQAYGIRKEHNSHNPDYLLVALSIHAGTVYMYMYAVGT